MSIVWMCSPLALIASLLISVEIGTQEASHAMMYDRDISGTADTVHHDGEHNRTSQAQKRDVIKAQRRAASKEKQEKENCAGYVPSQAQRGKRDAKRRAAYQTKKGQTSPGHSHSLLPLLCPLALSQYLLAPHRCRHLHGR